MIGLIGTKISMTQVFDETGVLIPVTVIRIEKNTVVATRNEEKNGYNAVVLGSVEAKDKRLSKPYKGQFGEAIKPTKHMFEIRDFEADVKVGDTLGLELFEDVFFVDVVGKSKGKGFQGVIKRHGFHGGNKTHGSKFHRAAGSTGMAAWPSRVFKGTKMPGRMGFERKTTQNLKVVKIDSEKQVLLVKGAVPGRNNSTVIVKQARKKY